jgi:hypothetical protein
MQYNTTTFSLEQELRLPGKLNNCSAFGLSRDIKLEREGISQGALIFRMP